MSTIAQQRKLQEETGYTPLDAYVIRCKAKFPAAVWRSLSVAERPYGHDITAVAVDDGTETVVAMPARHYDTLIDRVRELERWVGELVVEANTDVEE